MQRLHMKRSEAGHAWARCEMAKSWADVPAGDVFFLRGELGSGKTSLAVPSEGDSFGGTKVMV